MACTAQRKNREQSARKKHLTKFLSGVFLVGDPRQCRGFKKSFAVVNKIGHEISNLYLAILTKTLSGGVGLTVLLWRQIA